MNDSAAERALTAFRERIDRCDLAILESLRERARVVDLVGTDKRARGLVDVYRPGREAALMRRLAATDSSPFPTASLLSVWREIIGASFTIEGHPLNVVSGSESAWERARSHFRAARHSRASSASAAVRAVAAGEAAVAVASLDDDEPWWPLLAEIDPPLHIVARLPFAPGLYPAGAPGALVIARNPPDPSGDDLAVAIAAEATGETLAAWGGRFLVAARQIGADMIPVGGYAVPIVLKETAG